MNLQERKRRKENGCKFREWGWHDGGPDYGCLRKSKTGKICCGESYDDKFNCKYSDIR